MSNNDIILLIVIITIVLVQGTWVFIDASRRGENKWLWGIFCSLNSPTNLLIYLLVTRVIRKQKACPDCQQKQNKDCHLCPTCGYEWQDDKK